MEKTKKKLTLTLSSNLKYLEKQHASERIIEAIVTAPQSEKTKERNALNLSLVIDRSGSMQGSKLHYAKEAVYHVLSLLNDRDRVSIIAYDDRIETLLASAPASQEQVRAGNRAVRALEARAMTNLSDGWLTGAQQVADHRDPEYLNRVLLLTDGLANIGIIDPEELAKHASEIHERGVSTTTFGVGRDFNENLLELIATNGGGNYYFIDRPATIPEIFQMELDELSTVTSADTEIKFSIPANVALDVVGAWKSKKSAQRLSVHLGDIPGGQERILLLKMISPPKARRKSIEIKAKVTGLGEDGKSMKSGETIGLEYADREIVLNERADLVVMRSAASVFMAEAAREAHLLERRGMFKEAQRLLNIALMDFARYLSRAERARYQDISQRIEFGLDPMAAKKMHYDAHIRSRSVKRRVPDEKIR